MNSDPKLYGPDIPDDVALIKRADLKDLVIPCLSVALIGADHCRKAEPFSHDHQREYDRLCALLRDLKALCP